MDSKTLARMNARAQIIKAMAHPTRLFILDELGRGERCVCELTRMIGADVSTVSKHLSLMKSAGIVDCRKEGTSIFYTLRMPCMTRFLECVEAVIKRNCRQAAELAQDLDA